MSRAAAVRFTCTKAISANEAAFGATLAVFSLHKLVDPVDSLVEDSLVEEDERQG